MKIRKTMDGNTAAAYVAYGFTEVAAIYPITPSSPMSEKVDNWASKGEKNIFGSAVKVVEMQSEAGAAGALHGSLQAGALSTTFTASQGLLLMIPNMYKIAGELLPCVIHVAARAIATSSLNIFGDHQDVMAARQTGFAILCEDSVQEVMDLSTVAHLSTIKSRVPFVNFFDGFRTSHEIQKIQVIDRENFKEMVDYNAINEFRERALNPSHPVTRGTAQNPDIYFQTREAVNKYYENVPNIVENYMEEINKITGREYHVFDYYGAKDADRIIVAMGAINNVIEETIDYLNNNNNEKVGLIKVRLFRPFDMDRFINKIPKTVKKIAVLDRTKEPGSIGEPLYLDIVKSIFTKGLNIKVVGGRFGLGSKDPTPGNIASVFENLLSDNPKDGFTIGIIDDVTNTSLTEVKDFHGTPEGVTSCKFWGLGSDGTVGANKSAIKIIGDHTDMYAQGYFEYDSKKSGGTTISYLRFGDKPIKSRYPVEKADFIACHNQSYIYKYDVIKGLKKNGIFLLNTLLEEEELEEKFPSTLKKYIKENNINFYTINAVKIASEIGLGGRINMVMQGAFFKVTNIIPIEDAVKYLKEAVITSYGKKGEKVVNMNYAAIDEGIKGIKKINVPNSWGNIDEVEEVSNTSEERKPEFVEEIVEPMNKLQGSDLKVSTFLKHKIEDGTFMHGTTAYEKRGIAVNVPEWIEERCIQCNQCSYVCPHATIRPFLLNEDEKKNAPKSIKLLDAKGLKSNEKLYFNIGVSPLDCTGCGNCVDTCPAPGKALEMKPKVSQTDQIKVWNYTIEKVKNKNPMNKSTVKGSQFEIPLLEYNGACAGCGETAYARLVTQLFGDRMIIANATGCSSIWASSTPSTAYCTNEQGYGPAWANSLFEDNAEYGLGMYIGVNAIRNRIAENIKIALDEDLDEKTKSVLEEWLNKREESEGTRERANNLLNIVKDSKNEILRRIYDDREFFVKRSQWIFGGDGWAYDIGYGGLDHVLASNENVNILVFDTEVYSNTGGQSSKATQKSAVAKFASSGKRVKKKDLGLMAMSYGYVYVAQISMGADKNQTLKALLEAESYNGPSLIIAYAPCIEHGIKIGMGNSQLEEKLAVESGYWNLYRFNPSVEEGKNPLTIDSKEPKIDLKDFLSGEIRYDVLKKSKPKLSEDLINEMEKEIKDKLELYKKLSEI